MKWFENGFAKVKHAPGAPGCNSDACMEVLAERTERKRQANRSASGLIAQKQMSRYGTLKTVRNPPRPAPMQCGKDSPISMMETISPAIARKPSGGAASLEALKANLCRAAQERAGGSWQSIGDAAARLVYKLVRTDD